MGVAKENATGEQEQQKNFLEFKVSQSEWNVLNQYGHILYRRIIES